MSVNVFNLISRVNETRLLVQHQSCEGKYRSNNNVSNSKYIWNQDECRFEGKELDDWVYIDCLHVESQQVICECNKEGKIDEYLNIKKVSCGKRLNGKLALECQCKILSTIETLIHDKEVV